MPPPLPRLRLRRDFLRIARRGRSWAAPGLVLQAAPGPPGGGMRVGFTASRRVGGAVRRNRAKRRLRALAGALLPELGRPGHDYVLIARRGTPERAWGALVRDLRGALARAPGRGGGGR